MTDDLKREKLAELLARLQRYRKSKNDYDRSFPTTGTTDLTDLEYRIALINELDRNQLLLVDSFDAYEKEFGI